MTSLETPPSEWMGSGGKEINTVGCIKLNEKETVWVVSHEILIPDIPLPKGQMKFFKGARQEDLSSKYLKAILFQSVDKYGIRTLFDVAVNPKTRKE